MSRWRLSLLVMTAALLAACAARRTTHAPAPVEVAQPMTPAAPTMVKPPGKPHAEKNRANTSVDKSTALASSEVGYYLDVLQGRLQQQLDPAMIIARERGSIVLDLSRRLGFAADSTQLDDADRAFLLPLAQVLDEYRAALVSVHVSADDDVVAARRIAQQRANAIMRMLTDAGIAADRIVAVVPSAAARDGNAHVEILLVPQTRGD